VVAVFGTTSALYLFFWQASQEGRQRAAGRGTIEERAGQARAVALTQQVRTSVLGVSDLVAFFIMLTAIVTLHMQA
jgi:hypothetical protein